MVAICTDIISHPAFVTARFGFETGVAEYFCAPIFCFSGLVSLEFSLLIQEQHEQSVDSSWVLHRM